MGCACGSAATIGVILPLSPGNRRTRRRDNVLKSRTWTAWVNGAAASTVSASPSSSTTPRATLSAPQGLCTADHEGHCAIILAGWDSGVALAEIERRTGWESRFVTYAWYPT